jgi:hypothetical protein
MFVSTLGRIHIDFVLLHSVIAHLDGLAQKGSGNRIGADFFIKNQEEKDDF